MNSGRVKERLRALGADLCGVAGVDRFWDAPEGYHPLDVLPTCRSVIVFGVRIAAGTLACRTAVPYTVVRNVLSDRMDKMAVQFCSEMEEAGVLAVPTRTNGSELDPRTGRWRSIVSAKHAAQAAGLGTIGRHSLLITPEFGSLVWLSVVLTEAELEPDSMQERLCNDCGLCVKACPVHALEGAEVAQDKCWEHAFGEVNGDWRIGCHRCRDACPFCFGARNSGFRRS